MSFVTIAVHCKELMLFLRIITCSLPAVTKKPEASLPTFFQCSDYVTCLQQYGVINTMNVHKPECHSTAHCCQVQYCPGRSYWTAWYHSTLISLQLFISFGAFHDTWHIIVDIDENLHTSSHCLNTALQFLMICRYYYTSRSRWHLYLASHVLIGAHFVVQKIRKCDAAGLCSESQLCSLLIHGFLPSPYSIWWWPASATILVAIYYTSWIRLHSARLLLPGIGGLSCMQEFWWIIGRSCDERQPPFSIIVGFILGLKV